MRIIFMGTPDFAVPTLQALIDAPEHEVLAVYSQPPRPSGRGHKLTPSPTHQLAEQHHIPVFTPTSLKHESEQQQFRALAGDIAVVAAYGLLLPKAILEGCKHGCINVHPSALPRWRGAAPIQRTLMAGDSQTAMCIMQMDEGLDTGDVLLREPYSIPEGTTGGALHDLMAQKGADCILKALEDFENLTPQPQQGEPTYARKITKADAQIDWSMSSAQILAHIRGLAPYPAARALIHGEEVKLFNACTTSNASALTFKCGDGRLLSITELQRPGKKRMSAQEALRGWNLSNDPL